MSDHYETRCPSCGGSDEQGCYADCPTHHITALEARVRELEGALKPFAEFGEIMLPSDPTDNSPWATCSDETPVNNLAGQNISFGNFRAAARAALNQEKQK